jgi:hypothetical protein
VSKSTPLLTFSNSMTVRYLTYMAKNSLALAAMGLLGGLSGFAILGFLWTKSSSAARKLSLQKRRSIREKVRCDAHSSCILPVAGANSISSPQSFPMTLIFGEYQVESMKTKREFGSLCTKFYEKQGSPRGLWTSRPCSNLQLSLCCQVGLGTPY